MKSFIWYNLLTACKSHICHAMLTECAWSHQKTKPHKWVKQLWTSGINQNYGCLHTCGPRICWLHIHEVNLTSGDCGGHVSVMFKKTAWDDLSFVMWCIFLLEATIRRRLHCSYEEMNIVRNDAQSVLRGPNCANKISSTALHHHHQPDAFICFKGECVLRSEMLFCIPSL